MADSKSTTKFVLGVALLAALRVAYTIIKQFVKVTANVIVYFGLWVPFFYFLMGVVFVAIGAFSFSVVSINMVLFYIGLALCFGVAVGIFVRSYRRKPISSVAAGSADAVRRVTAKRKKRVREVASDASQPTRPLFVYYSEEDPTLLIHEYADYFDVYYDDRVHPISYLRRDPKPSASTGA